MYKKLFKTSTSIYYGRQQKYHKWYDKRKTINHFMYVKENKENMYNFFPIILRAICIIFNYSDEYVPDTLLYD